MICEIARSPVAAVEIAVAVAVFMEDDVTVIFLQNVLPAVLRMTCLFVCSKYILIGFYYDL